MALQTPRATQGKVRSIAAATGDGNLLEFLKTLRKDLIDLRNSVDALRASYVAHTHGYDASNSPVANTSIADAASADSAAAAIGVNPVTTLFLTVPTVAITE